MVVREAYLLVEVLWVAYVEVEVEVVSLLAVEVVSLLEVVIKETQKHCQKLKGAKH